MIGPLRAVFLARAVLWTPVATLLVAFWAMAADPTGSADPAPTTPEAEYLVGEYERNLPEGWYVRIDTSDGRILARLHPENAPQSVAHFAALADARLEWEDVVTGEVKKNHYYDGLIIHRAVAGRRIEFGDPHGTGATPAMIWAPPEVDKPINFSMGGRIGLTRAPLGKISASQIFITVSPEPTFRYRHPCIGTVVQGKDVVARLSAVKTYSNGRPLEPATIERLRVFKIGEPEPLPEPVPYTPRPGRLQLRRDTVQSQ